MKQWLITTLGSFVWGTVVLYAGLALFFPSEQVERYVKYEVQQSTSKKVLVDIGEVGFGILGNLHVNDLTVYQSKAGKRVRGQKETPPRENTQWFSVPNLTLRPQMLPLLRGRLMAGLGVNTPGGEVDLALGGNLSQFFLDIDTNGLDLSLLPISLQDAVVELAGNLQMESDLAFNLEEIKQSDGGLELSVEDLKLVNATVSGFSLPETAFSEAILNMQIEDGKLQVKKGSFVSDVLEVTIGGYINLRKDLLRSNANLKIQVRFDESYDKLAKIALKSSRDDDGVYHFRGSGRINNLRFRPDRSKSRKTDRISKSAAFDSSSRSSAQKAAKNSSISTEEREERRQKRRERLQERRERMRKRREERRESIEAREAKQQEHLEMREFDQIDQQYDDRRNEPSDYGDQRGDQNQYDDDPNNYQREDFDPRQYDDEMGQGQGYQEYDDPNDPNQNMDDLGYIDE